MNKNVLSLFFFIGLVSFNFNIKSAQFKKADISALASREKNAALISIFFQDSENRANHEFIEGRIEKIDDNRYQIVFKESPDQESYRVSLNEQALSSIYEDSHKNAWKKTPVYDLSSGDLLETRETKYSHLKVCIAGSQYSKDVYVKIGQDRMSEAFLSHCKPLPTKKPTKVVLSESSESDEADDNEFIQPKKSVEQTKPAPIKPNDFRNLHPDITSTTTVADFSETLDQNISARLKKEKKAKEAEEKKRIIDEETQKLAAEIERKRTEQQQIQRSLDMGFWERYRQKIDESTRVWHENSTLSDKEIIDLKAINATRAQLELPLITQEQYLDQFRNVHMNKLASWHIKQYRKYNKAQEREGLSPLSYQEFSKQMGVDIKMKDHSKAEPSTNRFMQMHEAGEAQLKFIEKINQKSKNIQATEQAQYSAEAYLQSRALYLSRDIPMTEGMIIATQAIRSLFPRQDVVEAIELYDTAIFDLQREINMQKDALSLMETKEEQEKKIHEDLFNIVEKNQKILHPKDKKNKKELFDSFKTQSDKHVPK